MKASIQTTVSTLEKSGHAPDREVRYQAALALRQTEDAARRSLNRR